MFLFLISTLHSDQPVCQIRLWDELRDADMDDEPSLILLHSHFHRGPRSCDYLHHKLNDLHCEAGLWTSVHSLTHRFHFTV